jgi:hypothetical protein
MRRVTGSRLEGRRLVLLAAALLVSAQVLAIVHELDPGTSAQGHVCAVCIAGADLGAGNVGSDVVFTAVEGVGACHFAADLPRGECRIRRLTARGPPVAS